ncbi:hypothetical protein SELMODRAFT_28320, partial [Selaginella moellendorffii]
ARDGHAADAIHLSRAMALEGYALDGESFTAILTACCHSGNIGRGIREFGSIVDHGLSPIGSHYCRMIDLLGRAGELGKAEDLIAAMPFPPCDVAWGTLLGACKVSPDVERGMRAAGQALELDGQRSGPYVMLSNLYTR